MAGIAQGQSVLSVTTPLGSDILALAGFSGREELSRLFSFQLDLVADNDRSVPLDRLVGQPMSVELALPNGGTRYFHGIVSRMSAGARGKNTTAYRAHLVPWLDQTTRTTNSRIFAHLTVPDIIREVLAGFGDIEILLAGRFETRDYCVQYRESDFAFASRLMEEEGIYYFFKHTQEGHTLVLADTPQSHPDVPGPRTVAFDPAGTSKDAAQSVFAWEKTQELRSGKVTVRDHNFQLPHHPLEATALIRESVQAGQVTHRLRIAGNDAFELFDYPGRYAQRFDGIDAGGGEQPAELQKLFEAARHTATVRMDEEAVRSLTIAGASNCRQLASGHRFTLSQHFDADGAYVLTGVSHTARVHDPKAGERGLTYDNTFTCIPEALPFRPARLTPRPVIPGTQTAFVVGPTGEQIFTDKYGRVKVQFHWDRQSDSSCWVRVSQAWSGTAFGAAWTPVVGDEVIVAFEEGDPDRPLVLGRVYNPERLPPPRTPQ